MKFFIAFTCFILALLAHDRELVSLRMFGKLPGSERNDEKVTLRYSQWSNTYYTQFDVLIKLNYKTKNIFHLNRGKKESFRFIVSMKSFVPIDEPNVDNILSPRQYSIGPWMPAYCESTKTSKGSFDIICHLDINIYVDNTKEIFTRKEKYVMKLDLLDTKTNQHFTAPLENLIFEVDPFEPVEVKEKVKETPITKPAPYTWSGFIKNNWPSSARPSNQAPAIVQAQPQIQAPPPVTHMPSQPAMPFNPNSYFNVFGNNMWPMQQPYEHHHHHHHHGHHHHELETVVYVPEPEVNVEVKEPVIFPEQEYHHHRHHHGHHHEHYHEQQDPDNNYNQQPDPNYDQMMPQPSIDHPPPYVDDPPPPEPEPEYHQEE